MTMAHITTLVATLILTIVSGLSGVIFYMAWQAFVDMRDNFKGLSKQFVDLQEKQADLPEKYCTWTSMIGPEGYITEIKHDREAKWLAQEKVNRETNKELTVIKTTQQEVVKWKDAHDRRVEK